MSDVEDDMRSMEDEASMGGEEGSEKGEDSDIFDTEGDDAGVEIDLAARVGGLNIDRAELASLSPPEQLRKWYEAVPSVEVDLITELDGTNLFFINVESMIMELLITKEVAFDEDTQFLHLVYAIEQTLNGIKESGGVFRLIFFDAFKKVFAAAFGEAVWAFREAFLLHCRTTGVDLSVFPHWYSPEWKEHVLQWRPSFFLLTNTLVELNIDEEDEEDAERSAKLPGVFAALALRCLSYKAHVALLRGLQRRGNRVMAFTIEPDMFEAFVDLNVKNDLQELLEETEEEEEGADEDIVGALQAFTKRAGSKVDERSLLRTFLAVRFVKNCLAKIEGQNDVTIQLMELVVKALLLQEILQRQIPIDKRAYTAPEVEKWGLFSDNITSALEEYYESLCTDLAKLHKAKLPEDLKFECCDLFDGRLYRMVFHLTVEQGMAAKGVIDAKFYDLQPWVMEELEFAWSESGAKGKFFPIQMKAVKEEDAGLSVTPPAMPPTLKPRGCQELGESDSELLKMLQKDVTFSAKDVQFKDCSDEQFPKSVLWGEDKKTGGLQWTEGKQYDSVLYEETMELNEGQKKMQEKLKQKGGKLTARDIEFQKKYALKTKQLALKALSRYSQSLTGSSKMHPPIIMKEHDGKETKKEEEKKDEKKLSAKHQELLAKQEAAEQAKIAEHDKSQMKNWEPQVEALGAILDPLKLEKDLLDLLLGYSRVTDSLVGFPKVADAFKTKDARCKVMLKVVKALRTPLKKIQLDRLPAERQVEARRLVIWTVIVIQEMCNAFMKELDAKGIKLLQEVLCSVGFKMSAESIYQVWAEGQLAAIAPAEDDKAKNGKDDKKKGKDDKKDDKKGKKDDKEKDKKDKKDGKDKKDKVDDKGGDAEKEIKEAKVTKDVELVWAGVGPDEFAFQMMYMGPHMTRVAGTAKDPKERVNFKPDGWQKNLLDIVDDNRSALVVAPTASGKTFIGYYVMDKVLRNSNDGVAVYVAPSKALVNQVSAEVYARFSSKTYPPHCKNELLGTFLREFNNASGVAEQGKWLQCQVLVTEPHILEMLLLSPTHQEWVKRLRYIVFDEVHCIGEQEGGSQWEHVMQLIPCPFIALSATVADPSFFHSWLERISAKKKQAEVELVIHTERWNDLYKHIFTQGEMKPLNPFTCLVEQAVRKSGLSQDITLTPQEMLQVFQEVRRVIGNKAGWEDLTPAKYFASEKRADMGHMRCYFLSKAEARKYEKDLKAAFLKALADGTIDAQAFQQMNLGLQSSKVAELAHGEAAFAPPARVKDQKDEGAEEEDDKEDDKVKDLTKMGKSGSYLQGQTLFNLCKNLESSDDLPAIVFNFSRKEIDRMVTKLLQELKDRQYDKYYGTEEKMLRSKKIMEQRMTEYKRKMQDYEQAQKMLGSRNQESNAARKNDDGSDGRAAAKGTEAVDCTEAMQMVEPVEPIDIADEIDPDFTFHSQKALGQWQEDIEELLEQLKYKGTSDKLIDALRRGIGMHHEGCKRNYKLAVEVLFRRGYLRVVFATGTLALGINMPCRSTIFCGDSLELNGLMFRQMAGRAGRRGFDLQGQIVFFDMGFPKIRRLVTSDLSSLTGEFVLSPTCLLRALVEWERISLDVEMEKTLARSKEDIARCLSPMFTIPFFRSSKVELETQVSYFTRWMIEMLRKEDLVGTNGYTKNLAYFVTHLFEIEPANFVISRILCSGELHNYLKQAKRKEKKASRKTHLTVVLTQVLAWFMYRRRLPSNYPERQPRKKHLPSETSPVLADLPEKLKAQVKKYNESVFEQFQSLAWAVASTRKIAQDDLSLPFTNKVFQPGWDKRGNPFIDGSDFAAKYIKQIIRFRGRSPFSAISGTGDEFRSPNDFCKYARSVTHFDANSLPMVAPSMVDLGELEATNSWAVDFMFHGKIRYLAEDNGLNATKAYKLISNFIERVDMMIAVLKVYSPPDDIVLETLEGVKKEMKLALVSDR
eukprot:TRINITY_DN4351_c0_g1_i1.p1 TRINITY_DN4351_c0_g1~~TRINITY_DN4351_c0_g1_i1.p1  ORF type:complete len:1954 (-),score=750.05 TRINITY_DN4351_c0_g1_i1:133-5994(-)